MRGCEIINCSAWNGIKCTDVAPICRMRSIDNYLAALEAAVREITESRDEWKRQWRLMEAAEKKAEEEIAALNEKAEGLKKALDYPHRNCDPCKIIA